MMMNEVPLNSNMLPIFVTLSLFIVIHSVAIFGILKKWSFFYEAISKGI